jgi:hypothetical protein
MALVTLEPPLLDKFLCFRPDAPVVTIGELPLLRRVYRPPSQGDVYTARDAHLLSWVLRIGSSINHLGVARLSPGAVGRRRRGCSAVSCLDRSPGQLRRRRHQGGLANGSCQGEVGLLEVLDVELEGVQSRLVDHIVDPVDNGLGRQVVFAPQQCRHGPALAIDRHDVELISPRAFDRRNVKSKYMTFLPGTFNVV